MSQVVLKHSPPVSVVTCVDPQCDALRGKDRLKESLFSATIFYRWGDIRRRKKLQLRGWQSVR